MKVKTLIVGLGNPGEKYVRTRHNTGFMVLDKLCNGEFKFEKKFNVEICDSLRCHSREGRNLDSGQVCLPARQARMTDNEIILMKPQTFMNSSGKAVKSFSDYYKISPENVLVVYDDVDIPFGEIRVREGGSSAGHKGIQSVIEHLGTSDFLRFRIGVKNENLGMIETEDFVLQKFDKNEEQDLSHVIKLCIDEINRTLETGDRKPKTLKVGQKN